MLEKEGIMYLFDNINLNIHCANALFCFQYSDYFERNLKQKSKGKRKYAQKSISSPTFCFWFYFFFFLFAKSNQAWYFDRWMSHNFSFGTLLSSPVRVFCILLLYALFLFSLSKSFLFWFFPCSFPSHLSHFSLLVWLCLFSDHRNCLKLDYSSYQTDYI